MGVSSATLFLDFLLEAILELPFRLDFQVLDRQVNYLVAELGFFGWVRWRREITCPLKPEEVLVILVLAPLRFVAEVLEAGQVKFTAQIELVGHNGASVLAKLVEGFDGARGVFFAKV